MSSDLEFLEQLLIGEDGMLLSLRMGDGLQEKKVQQVIDVLGKLSKEWSGSECIPKKAVDLFIDIFPVMQSSCDWYSEAEVIKIMDAADQIVNSIRDCIIG